MYKILVHMYKSVGLNTTRTSNKFVIDMNESRKSIVGAAATAVIVVAFLGFLSHQFFPTSNIPTSFALAWLHGKQEPTNNTITLLISTLSPKLTFQNETLWMEEEVIIMTDGIPEELDWMVLQGEYNATWFRSMSIHPYNLVCTSTDLPFEGAYNITMTINTTIYVSLEAMTYVDLGVYDCWNESYIVYQNDTYGLSSSLGEPTWNNSGLWAPQSVDWEIDVEKLSSMLQGSGTALLTFRGVLRVNVDYEITTNGVKKTNGRTLSWEGNMGIIKVTYDQNRIISIKYEIPAVGLTMLTTSE